MAKARSPWRLLRPLLLAGAVTATWLTLSSSAASADTSAEPGSLLGGVTSSVSTLSAPLKGAVAPVVETKSPAAPAAVPTGLLQPVVGTLASTTDQLVAAVPAVKSTLPSGTVSAATIPIASAADGAVAGLVEAAVPPLVEAVPVLEPVMQPVAGLVTGATPLPAVPGVLDPTGDLSEALASDTAALPTAGVPAPAVPENAAAVIDVAAAPLGIAQAAAQISAAGTPSASFDQAAAGAPLAEEPSPSPTPAPATPGSGAGGGASPSGPSGAAAWLNDFDLDLPLSGTDPVSGASGHAPSPVSFDPGSSPD